MKRTPGTRTMLGVLSQIFFSLTLLFALTCPSSGQRLYVDELEYRAYDGSAVRQDNGGVANGVMPTLSTSSRDIESTTGLAKLGLSYVDGKDQMYTQPNPRDLSNRLFKSLDSQVSDKLSMLHNSFGQFVAMDIIQIEYSDERADIEVPKGDPFFDPDAKGARKIPFRRAKYFKNTTESARQFRNLQTAFLDLSHVYGTSDQAVRQIRTFKKGKLITNSNNSRELLPYLKDISADVSVWRSPSKNTTVADKSSFFFSNHPRVNQDLSIIGWHTLFVLYHNYLCDTLFRNATNWSDERIFQEARKWNIAIYQNIVFIEYIPALNGVPLATYTAYKSSVPFSLTHAFGIVPVSHVNVRTIVPKRNFRTSTSSGGNLVYRDTLYSPQTIASKTSLDELFLGQFMEGQRSIPDTGPAFVDDIRNFLPVEQVTGANYTQTGDLCAILIQRGRDMGLPLIPNARIAEVQDATLQDILRTAYQGQPVDYVSMMIFLYATSIKQATEFGRLSDIFRDLRDSDRFYYESDDARFSDAEIDQIRGTRVTTVISELVSETLRPQFTKQLQGFFTPSRAGINDNPTDIVSEDTFVLPDPKFAANLLITHDYKISWNLTQNLEAITLRLTTRFSSAGWWAMGFEPDGPNKMVGMDAVICKVDAASNSISAHDYTSAEVGQPNQDTERDGTDDVVPGDWRRENGISYCTVTRPIKGTDRSPIDKTIPLSRQAMVTWAYNPADISFNYHGPTRGYRNVDFTTRKYNLTFIIDYSSNPKRFSQISAVTTATLALLNRNGLVPQTEMMASMENSNSDSGTAVQIVLERKQYDPFVYNNKTIVFVGDEATSVTTAAQLVTRTIKIPQINPFNRVSDVINSDWDYFYRSIPTYSSQTKIIASIIKLYGWKNIVGLFSNDEYSPASTLVAQFKDEGVDFQEVQVISTSAEVGRSLSDLRSTRVRVFVLWVSSSWVIDVLRTARAYGMTGEGYIWICADSVFESVLSESSLYAELKPALKGFITLTPSRVVDNGTFPDEATYDDLLESMRSIYQFTSYLDDGSPFFYLESMYVADTIYAVALAVQEMTKIGVDPTDGAALNKYLANTDFQGITGHMNFSKNRERVMYSYEVWNSDADSNFQTRFIVPINNGSIVLNQTRWLSNITFGDGTTTSPPDYIPYTPPEVVWIRWGDPVAIAAVVIASVMITVFLGVFVMLVRYQGHKVIRASSPIFLFTTLVGVVIAYVCVYVFTAEPTRFVCNLRPWLVSLSFALIFGSLLVKTYRIVRILGTLDWARIGKLSTNTLLVYMVLISSVYLIILIVWMAYDPLYVRDDGENANADKLSKICDSSHRLVFEGVLYGYSGVLLLSAAVIAFKSRHVKSEYGEAQWIALTLYNIVIAGVVIIPVAYAVKEPVAVYSVIVFGIMWAATATGIFFFFPKFFLIFHGTGSTSSAGHTPGGHGSGSGSGSGSGTGTGHHGGYNHNL